MGSGTSLPKELHQKTEVIYCQKCGAPICVRGSLGLRIPTAIKAKMKGVNKDGVEKQLCGDCEDKEPSS